MLFVISCKNEKSLQSYLVETSSKEGFYTGDVPVNSMFSAKADISKDMKEITNSIKKINIAFLPKTADNIAAYEIEKRKLKNIFKENDTYKNLMSMKVKEMNIKVFYSGDTASVDEVIAFGFGDKIGVGVVRLLGENMNPAKIIEMLKSLDYNESSSSLKQLFKIYNN